MPGAFAHLTLVSHLCSGQFINGSNLPASVKIATQDYSKFVDLGAVSPDYPYLAVMDSEQKIWADNMHYVRVGDLIRRLCAGVATLRGDAQTRALAWCLGYVAHVVTDMTIHPVVELKVGTYLGNENAHRICEMHQDTYIFQRLNLDSPGLAEYLDGGLAKCSISAEDKRLDPDISELWAAALTDTYSETWRQKGPPEIDSWHRWFIGMIDKIAEEGGRLGLIPLARHVGQNLGLIYPSLEDVDHVEYIDELKTPEGVLTYDEIFDRAQDNVANAWQAIGEIVVNRNPQTGAIFGPWNLDTDRNTETDKHVYWNI